MKQVTYQGVFEPAADGGFSVYFPDLPGCASYGATLDGAQKNARDALGLHLYGMEKDGDPIPAPSTTPEIDPETAPGYVVCPVTVSPGLVRDELDNRLLHYKGYTAKPEYSAEDRIFYGTILGISDMVDFQSESEKNLEAEFHKAVNGYLKFCAETGKEPQKLVRAWDPDFTKVTPEEAKRIEAAERSGFVAEDDIDWNNIGATAGT